MPGDFAKLRETITAADLDAAWRDRLEDATVLETSERYAAAIAARLYALEIYLKFRICRHLDLSNPPRALEIHQLDALLVYTGLKRRLEDLPGDSDLAQNWAKILTLSKSLNALRYQPAAEWSRGQAEDFSRWLLDESTGVLTWLRNQT